jgi:hypothetical protein
MNFRWNEWNIDHVGEHGVDSDEAERVVGDEKNEASITWRILRYKRI